MPPTLFTRDINSPSPFYSFDPNQAQNQASVIPLGSGSQPTASSIDWSNVLISGGTPASSGLNVAGNTFDTSNLSDLRTYGLAGAPGTRLGVNPSNGPGGAGLASTLDWTKLGIGSAMSLFNLYNSWQSGKLAKQQFEYSKGLSDTNLYNSATNYNAALESQVKSAGLMNGTSNADIAARIAKYSAKTKI